MKILVSAVALTAVVVMAWTAVSPTEQAVPPPAGDRQAAPTPRTAAGEDRSLMPRLYDLEDAYLRWPLPAAARQYEAIDGKHLSTYVADQVGIARRYRDQGHPQFWGRIIGTSGDAESAEWVAGRFKGAGLTDVRIQPIDLVPQWMAHSWQVEVSAGGTATPLTSAQPAYATTGTPKTGLDLEAVYVGLGSDADFLGRDVRGKAVFIFSPPKPTPGAAAEGALARASEKGAAAIFDVTTLPGNVKYQSYPVNTTVPTFAVGQEDGRAVRELLGRGGPPPRIRVQLHAERVPNLKTALVWGTLPGQSDETIYVIAHRDGWFDAAGDNASGVASMIGLAEYFAKVPRAERRRTMVFIGTDGHHNTGVGGGAGREWLVANRDQFFTKTALMINCEHPSTLQTYLVGAHIRASNTYTAQQWYAGGPSRPELQAIAVKAFQEFGVPTYAEPNRVPPGGDLGRFWWFLPGVATSDFHHYFHLDGETAETVPWTGMEATTRAYARIIDEVNKHDLGVFRRAPEPADPRPPAPIPTSVRSGE
jgi:hypothetical protein